MKCAFAKVFALCLLWLGGGETLARAPTQLGPAVMPEDYPEKILFLGNSFTYYNDGLHKHYGNLLRAADLYRTDRNKLRMLTYSGSGLWEHSAALHSALINDRWDAVVMHDYSNGPITEWDRFVSASDALGGIARAQDTTPILMMTWAYAGQPEMTLKLAEAYTKRGKDLGAKVIPVGLAFAAAVQQLGIDLYSPDLRRFDSGQPVYEQTIKHPSLAGTYLAACTVYAALTGRTPEGLIYTAGLDPEVARDLQRVAFLTVQSYQHKY